MRKTKFSEHQIIEILAGILTWVTLFAHGTTKFNSPGK